MYSPEKQILMHLENIAHYSNSQMLKTDRTAAGVMLAVQQIEICCAEIRRQVRNIYD